MPLCACASRTLLSHLSKLNQQEAATNVMIILQCLIASIEVSDSVLFMRNDR